MKSFRGFPTGMALLALVGLTFGATVVVAAAVDGPRGELGTPAAATPSEPTPSGVSRAQSDLSVLRRARELDDQVPGWMLHRLEHGLAGENASLARRARGIRVAGEPVFVVPAARDQVCLYDSLGGACTFISDARAGRFLSVRCASEGYAVLRGMLPDGARNVEVVLSSGERRALTVEDNVYAAELPATSGPVRVRWEGPGDQEIVVPLC